MSEFNSSPNKSMRIEWIDIAKGISIILVVLGHTRISETPFIGDWLGAYRMPFFFFVSGILFNPLKTGNIQQLVEKKWKGLIRPFFIFSILGLIGFCFLDKNTYISCISSFPRSGWGGVALWFIPVLFITNILYFIVCKLIKSRIFRLAAILVLAIIGFITYKLDTPNYWNINFALTAVLFYGLGNIAEPILKDLFLRQNVIIIAVCLFSALISFCFIFNSKPEFFVNKLGSGVLTHVVGIAGAIMLCCIAFFISRLNHPLASFFKETFKYFGKNSYIVLAFHQITILLIAFWFPQLPALIRHIVMWGVIILLIEIITRKFPYIIGRN